MGWLEFIVQLSSSLSWPITIMVCVFFLRGQLEGLIPRLLKVGPSGVEFSNNHQSSKGLVEPKDLELVEDNLPQLTNPLMEWIEDRNIKQLALMDANQKQRILTRALTVQETEKTFVGVYAEMFGSQLDFLRLLRNQNMLESSANEYLGRVKQEFSFWEGADLQEFTRFLFTNQLIELSERRFRLTAIGIDFLVFLDRSGVGNNRPN